MDTLPLTSPAPWEEIPVGVMESLWPELDAPVEITVTLPGVRGSRRVTMAARAGWDEAEGLLLTAFRSCRGAEGFELAVRPAAG